MSASNNLNKNQFGVLYHGTQSELKPGDIISHENASRTPARQASYATRSHKIAAKFAGEGGRVYKVAPVSEDPEHTWSRPMRAAGNTWEVVSTKGFTVLGERKSRKKK